MGILGTPDQEKQRKMEVVKIREIVGDAFMPGVEKSECISAIDRAVHFCGLEASDRTREQLIEIITTHEKQLDVHSKPSDPNDE